MSEQVQPQPAVEHQEQQQDAVAAPAPAAVSKESSPSSPSSSVVVPSTSSPLSSSAPSLPPERKLLLLISKGVSDRTQASNQSKAMSLLEVRGVPFITINGMDPSQRELRNELFAVSGIRGNYPQFFFLFEDGSISFLGNWEKIEGINETDNLNLPVEVLEAHPEIETWNDAFGRVVQEFSNNNNNNNDNN